MTASPRPPSRASGVGRPAAWVHLARRFFGFLASRPLSPREQSEVAAMLGRDEAALFFRQQMQDQRHAVTVMRRVLARRPGDRMVARAALLHDVGKVGIELGAVRRAAATVADLLHVPLRGRYLRYRRHGAAGARELERLGAPAFVVAFAREHPGEAPPGEDAAAWRELLDADHG